jgi:hypothetical protein
VTAAGYDDKWKATATRRTQRANPAPARKILYRKIVLDSGTLLLYKKSTLTKCS